jgi:hypothetical protein
MAGFRQIANEQKRPIPVLPKVCCPETDDRADIILRPRRFCPTSVVSGHWGQSGFDSGWEENRLLAWIDVHRRDQCSIDDAPVLAMGALR